MPVERLVWIGVAVASIVLVLLELLLAPALSRCCFPSTEYAFFTDPLVKANLNPEPLEQSGGSRVYTGVVLYRDIPAYLRRRGWVPVAKEGSMMTEWRPKARAHRRSRLPAAPRPR